MSSFFLKIFALVFMIIDHIGFIIFPNQIMFRAIGRLAFPLFAYQMAVGFSHTKNKSKHILKLLVFAIICQIPTSIATSLYTSEITLNVIFTFILALLVIYTVENLKFFSQDKDTKTKKFNFKNFFIIALTSVLLGCLGVYLNVDYTWYGMLLPVAFYFTLSNKSLSIILFFLLVNLKFIFEPTTMSLLAYISLIDCIFILFFNGKQGYKFSWIFYVAFFLHMFPLFAIKEFLI